MVLTVRHSRDRALFVDLVGGAARLRSAVVDEASGARLDLRCDQQRPYPKMPPYPISEENENAPGDAGEAAEQRTAKSEKPRTQEWMQGSAWTAGCLTSPTPPRRYPTDQRKRANDQS